MKVKAANGLVRALRKEGVKRVSCYPTNHVNNACGEEAMPMIMFGEERHAVALADATSRVTCGRDIGVCTVMANLNAAGIQMAYGAIAQAWEDSSPLLVIAEGVGRGASRHTHFNMAEALGSVTKWVGTIDRAELVPDYVRRAYTLMRTGRPGPVLLVVPRDLGEYDEDEFPYHPVKGWRSAPDPVDVKAAVKALLAAKRPLIYAGEGVHYAHATDELVRFAEAVQVPVLTSLKAKSAIPENHPLSVGARGSLANQRLIDCDLVFGVGTSLFPNRFSHAIPDAHKKIIVQCNVDALDINRSYETHHAVIGDAKMTLQALIAEVEALGGAKTNGPLIAELESGRAEFWKQYTPWLTSEEKPINPYRVFGELQKVLDPKNSFVTADSGTTRDQTSTVYQAEIPRGYMGWGNVSTLGFSLPAAVAARLAYPGRQCVNVTGDAGIGYMMGTFESVSRYKIGITTIHIANGGYAGYGPGFWGPGHDPYTYVVSAYPTISTAAMAKAMGWHGETVTEPSEVNAALKRALAANENNKPAFLEFVASQHPVHGGWVGR
jgi:thiamine pyrophosphate-dependent acetolactate synthase large subunit-like protein